MNIHNMQNRNTFPFPKCSINLFRCRLFNWFSGLLLCKRKSIYIYIMYVLSRYILYISVVEANHVKQKHVCGKFNLVSQCKVHPPDGTI